MSKLIIIVLMLCMIVALAIGLFQLLKTPNERDTNDKLFKALTWRISIWVVLFVFILLSIKLEWIKPSNSVHPIKFNELQQQRIDKANMNNNKTITE